MKDPRRDDNYRHFCKLFGRRYKEGRHEKELLNSVLVTGVGAFPGEPTKYQHSQIFKIYPFVIGANMERATEAIKEANVEAQESRAILEDLKNQIVALSDALFPTLIEQVTKMREARMAIVAEMRTSLNMLQDVRKFFIESDYEKETARLQQFVSLCEKIRELKRDGTFDAVCDTAIRLALQEKSDERQGT